MGPTSAVGLFLFLKTFMSCLYPVKFRETDYLTGQVHKATLKRQPKRFQELNVNS